MKFWGILFTLFMSFSLYATPGQNCEAIAKNYTGNIGSVQFEILIQCLANPEEFDLNSYLNYGCKEAQHLENYDICIDDKKLEYLEKTVKGRDPMHEANYGHCEKAPTSSEFCFLGRKIIDEGAMSNETMMQYLCTDDDLPESNLTLRFGPCTEKDMGKENALKAYDTSCYCQYVEGERSNGLAWHCTQHK